MSQSRLLWTLSSSSLIVRSHNDPFSAAHAKVHVQCTRTTSAANSLRSCSTRRSCLSARHQSHNVLALHAPPRNVPLTSVHVNCAVLFPYTYVLLFPYACRTWLIRRTAGSASENVLRTHIVSKLPSRLPPRPICICRSRFDTRERSEMVVRGCQSVLGCRLLPRRSGCRAWTPLSLLPSASRLPCLTGLCSLFNLLKYIHTGLVCVLTGCGAADADSEGRRFDTRRYRFC